jgi:hypothetical protein
MALAQAAVLRTPCGLGMRLRSGLQPLASGPIGTWGVAPGWDKCGPLALKELPVCLFELKP